MRSTLKYVAIAFASAMGASAAPPTGVDLNSPLAQWYKSLNVPNTDGSCCSIADCRPVEARRIEDHWEVLVKDEWFTVPEDRIIRRQHNMDGRPIACLGVTEYGFYPSVRCFVPPPET